MSGLKWKIYAFDDEESMEAHMENLRKMEKAGVFPSGVELKAWDVQESLSRITGAPI